MARRTASSDGQRGFTLAGLLAILTVVMIFVTMTVPPQWSKVMARERDMQTIFIMKQYARSIRNFQLKHGSAPVSLQQLKDAKAPRMMRGKGEWIDPLTGKVDWIPIPASAQQGTTVLPPGVAPPVQSVRPSPPPTPATPPPAGGTPGSPGGTVGPIVGVRPAKTGKSFLTLNGADTYEQWSYTVQDLENEINGRRAALATK
jgi:type II secretory pathway pseudopilin PulG